MEQVVFDQYRSYSSAAILPSGRLRSWVQIPPGPLLLVLEIRYCFKRDFNDCRTNPQAHIQKQF